MTKPISEPSWPRSTESLGYRDRQLARRPPPIVAVEQEIVYAYLARTSNLTIVSATDVPVFTTATAVELTESDNTIINIEADGSNNLWFRFLDYGIYVGQFTLSFALPTFTGEIQGRFDPFDQQFFLGADAGVSPSVAVNVTEGVTRGVNRRVISVAGTWLINDLFDPGTDEVKVRPMIGNLSGANRTLQTASASMYRVKALPPPS